MKEVRSGRRREQRNKGREKEGKLRKGCRMNGIKIRKEMK